ncbi:MAG: hypothetical protein RMI91_06000 [Gemmatales bacterium]|nr:hypothetical protein [Gemmatales bacterium]MDW7994188.1 hypothetical protein [Gemmatales bacterium]
MSMASQPINPVTPLVEESQARSTATTFVEASVFMKVLRGLFWGLFGIAGHIILAIVGLLATVLIILSPILVLGGLVQLIAWLWP